MFGRVHAKVICGSSKKVFKHRFNFFSIYRSLYTMYTYTMCVCVCICACIYYNCVQVMFPLEFLSFREYVCFISVVKFIGKKLHIMFFYPFHIYRVYNDVIFLVPDIDNIVLLLAKSVSVLSVQRTSLWFSWFPLCLLYLIDFHLDFYSLLVCSRFNLLTFLVFLR